LPNEILAEAGRTHPTTSTAPARMASPTHFGAEELGAPLALAEDRPEAHERTRGAYARLHALRDVRRNVRWEAQSAGLSVDVVDDLLLAVSELLTSWVAMDGATAVVRTARESGEWFCEVSSD